MSRSRGVILFAAFLCLASTVLGTSYFLSRSATVDAADQAEPTRQTVLETHQDASHPAISAMDLKVDPNAGVLSGEIFRLPLDPQESFFLRIEGDGGEMRYGTGAWASLIQQWRSEELFADSTHAWVEFPKMPLETDTAGNKGADSERRLVPVDWRDGQFSWQSDRLPAFRWQSGTVMRVRSEPSPKTDTDSLAAVTTVRFNTQGVEAGVAYMRGRDQQPSQFVLRTPSLALKDRTWLLIRFERSGTEPAHDEIVVVAALSGEIVSELDSSVRLSAGTAACLLINHRSQVVKALQQAKLERGSGRILLSWQAIEDGYDPVDAWIFQLGKEQLEYRPEQLGEFVLGSYHLSPYAMWARQSGIPHF